MFSMKRKKLSQVTNLIFAVLFSTFSQSHYALAQAEGTPDPLQDARAKVKSLEDALKSVDKACDGARNDLQSDAMKRITSLPDAGETNELTEAALNRIKDEVKILLIEKPANLLQRLGQDRGNFNKIDKKDLQEKQKSVQTIISTPPKEFAEKEQVHAKELDGKATKVLADAETQGSIDWWIKSINEAAGPDTTTDGVIGLKVKGVFADAASLVDLNKALLATTKRTTGKVPGLPDENFTAPGANDTAEAKDAKIKTAATNIRDALVAHLPTIKQVGLFTASLSTIRDDLQKFDQTPFDLKKNLLAALNANLDTLKSGLNSILACLPSHLGAAKEWMQDAKSKLVETALRLPERDGTEDQQVKDGQRWIADCETIDKLWQELSNKLSNARVFGEDVVRSVQSVDGMEEQLTLTQLSFKEAVDFLESGLSGDPSKFVNDQIRLFYFTDIPRLMYALNPTASVINPESLRLQEAAAEARKSLVAADGDLASAIHEVNDSRTRVLSIREQIRQATAEMNDATQRSNRADKLLKDLQDRQANTQYENEKTRLTDEITAQKKVQDDATATLNEVTSRRAALLDEQSGLPARLQEAETRLASLQSEVERLRAESRRQVADEMDAFVASRDNAPIRYAPGRFFYKDPTRKVTLFGYEDSKTIFLRGIPDDVRRVKEIIASFDRPAPQARITLWTLQLNGQYSNQLNQAIRNIDNELRDLRGNIVLVQDVLRNCINREVNRAAKVAQMALDPSQYIDGRIARYFFYPYELRRELGFDVYLPDKLAGLAEALYELQIAEQYYVAAGQDHVAASQYGDTNNKENRVRESECINKLRWAWYHFSQYQKAYEALEPQIKRNITEVCLAVGQDGDTKLTPNESFSDLGEQNTTLHNRGKDISKIVRSQNLKFPSDFGEQDATIKALRAAQNDLRVLLEGERKYIKTPDKSNAEHLPSPEQLRDAEYVTRWTLPDPAHATTLGEMLFVLSLGKHRSRERILQSFLIEVSQLGGNGKAPESHTQAAALKEFKQAAHRMFGNADIDNLVAPADAEAGGPETLYPLFPGTVLGSLGSVVPAEASNQELTANQLEILLAIKARVREGMSAEVRNLLRQIRENTNNLTIVENLRKQYRPLVGWLYQDFNVVDQSAATTPVTWSEWGETALGGGKVQGDLRDTAAQQIADQSYQRNPLSLATPRVAAADDMIKRFITVAEGDLEHFFVAKALDNIRENAVPKCVQLGTIQRESILTTNRMVARIDPNANADVELDQATDFLASATQLAQLSQRYQEEKQATAMSAGLTVGTVAEIGKNGFWKSLGAGGVIGMLSALTAQPRQPEGEIYSINSGNLFKVTPIFDPSGQALRFKFDFTANVRVQEPNGTTNRQVPQVEHHSVNTEVQLSNLEVREISRFETNSRIGTPSQRSGGIPFLNQVPLLKEIPIIGYYVKQGGSKSVRQESLIFAQTSIYPTVADIVDLLVDAPLRDDLEGQLLIGSDYDDTRKDRKQTP